MLSTSAGTVAVPAGCCFRSQPKTAKPAQMAAATQAIEKARRLGSATCQKQIRQSGVRILPGSDQSSFLEQKGAAPGRSLHEELTLLVEAGLTPAQVLRAATSDSALFLGLADQLGTIEAGKNANLVLMEANPPRDIRNTIRIAVVIAEGLVFDRKALDRLVGGVLEARPVPIKAAQEKVIANADFPPGSVWPDRPFGINCG